MRRLRAILAFLLLWVPVHNYAQLAFCPGSKGEPIFTENFGNGSTYGPALPAGTTTYPFVVGAPNDGFYTLFYHSNLYSTWHYSLDHTPDATNGPNGKMLIVNANAVTSGDFYKKTVTGLCINTTFEFSAWLLNVYNPNSNFCGAGEIPINVRFEIWNATETVLLGSGNTGNIIGTSTPVWQQFALVFTTVSETSVVLKMKNNGLGGCGNDLAIDDISFSACGDLTTVQGQGVVGNTYTTCTNPASLTLTASTGGLPYFYQWQSSSDGTTWSDIPGENNPVYNASGITSTTHYRVKAAQDLANLSNVYCSTSSNVFTVSILPGPTPAVSNGDQIICSNEAIPTLGVTLQPGTSVNWYNAPTGGTLLLANSASYLPAGAGTYYAETYNTLSNCIGSPRTPVKLTIVPLPDAAISGTASICSGTSTPISFNGTPNAILTYTVNNGPNQSITLNGSGSASLNASGLSANTVYTLIGVTSPDLSSCSRVKNETATITVNNAPTANISSNAPVCPGTSATINFSGTPGATVTYYINTGPDQTINLDASGNASIVQPNVTTSITYSLRNVSLGGLCQQSLTQSVNVTSEPAPTASISANPLVICSNQTSTITFTGTPNASVRYRIDGGPLQTVLLDPSGTAVTTTPANLGVNSTYALAGVTSGGANACSSMVNGAVTITVNAVPTAIFSTSSQTVCSGSSISVGFTGTPGAIVSYTPTGGGMQTVTLNAAGTASFATNITATTTYTLNSVATAGPNGCTKMLGGSVVFTVSQLPTATILANPAAICSNQTSVLQFSGTPNAVVSYTATGGSPQSVTLNASGFASVPVNLTSDTTYQLNSASLAGCSQVIAGSANIVINPTPDAAYVGDLDYCEGETTAIVLSSSVAGAVFSWVVTQNGVTGAASGTGNQISQTLSLTAAGTGTVTYTITPFYNGCTGMPLVITVTVHPLPVPQIADGVICLSGTGPASSQFYTLDTQLNAATHTFAWFFDGNPIPGASGSTYDAYQIGLYSVIATNAAGCVSAVANAQVGERNTGERLVLSQSEAFSDDPTVSVAVVGGDGPFLYQLDMGAPQTSNVFYNVAPGAHTLTVVDEFCTFLTATVTILDYPKFFTPNDDGYHDTWNIDGISDAMISIFDRYGKLLKQISTNGAGWNGTYNGRLMPATDYWFVIDYRENGMGKSVKAHFSLKR